MRLGGAEALASKNCSLTAQTQRLDEIFMSIRGQKDLQNRYFDSKIQNSSSLERKTHVWRIPRQPRLHHQKSSVQHRGPRRKRRNPVRTHSNQNLVYTFKIRADALRRRQRAAAVWFNSQQGRRIFFFFFKLESDNLLHCWRLNLVAGRP